VAALGEVLSLLLGVALDFKTTLGLSISQAQLAAILG